MTTKTISLLTVLSLIGAMPLSAQGVAAKTSAATLTLDTKTYTLSQAMAYETTIDNEAAIAVVLTSQPILAEKLKEAREAEKDERDPEFKRPFLRLVFKKTGEFMHWNAGAGTAVVGHRSGKATGELKLQDGRVSGEGSEPATSGGVFVTAFDAHFNAALLKAGDALPASTARKGGPAANVKPSVTGVFKGNGKDAKLAYVSARWGEPFDDKPGIVLVFTEKDHSKDKKADFNASFGKFGSALIISLHEDGGIYGCQVVHSAHQKQGFSSIGNIETNGFTYEDGKVEGELSTGGPVDTFGETWEVKLKFVAPLGEIPKELQPAVSEKSAKEEKTAQPNDTPNSAVTDTEPVASPAMEGLKAKDLALTKDATDVEYKALVEHVLFKSKADVKSVCAELAGNLKAQGWTSDGSDMIQPHSSILRRQRGDATLTIFVKPGKTGSEVQMMTEGLSWDEL
ncbi:MAG: hypothetical protein ABIR29_11660 [Chthoniobacterales bacterium]